MLIVIGVSSLFSVALYYLVHPFWSKELTEETKKTADNIAMRIGVVYAVVIGMMFANVRIEHLQMINAIESEASALSRLYSAIGRETGENNEAVLRNIVEYIQFIVDEQWPALREARALPQGKNIGGRLQLDLIWNYIHDVERKEARPHLRKLLDDVEHYRAIRLFDAKGSLLPLFWYIAFFGFLASLLPLYIYAPNLRRCALISLYSSMVSVVLLGIFTLSHPYSTAAGVEPDIFKWLLEASPSSGMPYQ